MNLIKNITGRIWALWGLLFFIGTMLIAIIFYLPCFLLKEPYAAQWHRLVSRVWMTIYLNAIGCPLFVKGKEHFARGQNYIVICNHNSLMDIPVTTPFMPQANKTIAKKGFARVPIFGWIYSLGSVLVDRSSERSRRQSYDRMKNVLTIGLDMVIYPEGTRNRSKDPLKSFYDGAFRLSADTGKPLLPTLVFNTKKVLPVHKFFYLSPHKIELHFLEPVYPAGLTHKELKEKLFRLMWDYYATHNIE